MIKKLLFIILSSLIVILILSFLFQPAKDAVDLQKATIEEFSKDLANLQKLVEELERSQNTQKRGK